MPLFHVGENAKANLHRDVLKWCDYLGIKFRFPQTFPLRTVLPLRVSIANKEPALMDIICKSYHGSTVIIVISIHPKNDVLCIHDRKSITAIWLSAGNFFFGGGEGGDHRQLCRKPGNNARIPIYRFSVFAWRIDGM